MLRQAAGIVVEAAAAVGRPTQQPQCFWRALAAFSSSAAAQGPSSQAASAAETLAAEPRSAAGTIPSTKLRQAGRTPGVLFSRPGEAADALLLSFDSKTISKAVQRLGRTGWAVSLFDLEISGDQTVRALGRQVHMRADTDEIENVTFIACPPERVVRIDVPLRVIGEELCPGLKAGGKLNWIRRTIPCLALGNSIPSAFEVDISGLAMNQKKLFSDLDVPPGIVLRVKTPELPILKVAK